MSSDANGAVGESSHTLGIVVVNYRSVVDVEGLARSVPARLAPRLTAFCVVDNSDVPEDFARAAAILAARGVHIDVVYPGENLGFGRANNVGLRHVARAGCDVAWFLNPDTRIVDADPGALERGLRAEPDAVLLGTGVVTASGVRAGLSTLSLRTGRVVPPTSRGPVIAFVNGNSMLARIPELLELGGFDERFFLFFEEADLALRSQAADRPLGLVAGITIAHDGGGSTGSRRGERRSEVAVHHAHRSCVLFFAKHRPHRLVPVIGARLANCARLLASEPRIGRAAIRGTLGGIIEVAGHLLRARGTPDRPVALLGRDEEWGQG